MVPFQASTPLTERGDDFDLAAICERILTCFCAWNQGLPGFRPDSEVSGVTV
jgi:hypothetical protein